MNAGLKQAEWWGAAGMLLLSCVPVVPPTEMTTPDRVGSDLAVTASTATPTVFEGLTVTLSAAATGGTSPYLYRWDQNAGPQELTSADVTGPSLTTEPLTTAGRYVFRVTVTDDEGFHAVDFVALEVARVVTASAPRLVVVDEPVALTATVETDVEEVTLLWEVVRGNASLDDPTSAGPMLTTTTGETIGVTLTVGIPSDDETPVTTTQDFDIVSVFDLMPSVVIETNFGEITLELDGELAPLHTANFLQYVDETFYDGLLFHRSACEADPESGECEPFVLQGGGFERVGEELQLREATHDPVSSEADNGLSNGEVHSVALALAGGNPDSGTTQFFINLKDNGFLDDQAFTVFGMVVGGADVIDAIVAIETTDSMVIPGEQSLPVEDVIIQRVRRAGL